MLNEIRILPSLFFAVLQFLCRHSRYRALLLGLGLLIGSPANAEILMMAHITFQGAPTTVITPPAGWTLLRRDNASTGTAAANSAIYYRIATVEDNSAVNYTFTLNPARRNSAAIAAYDGIDPLTPFGATGFQASVTTSATITAPSVAVTANDQIVRLFTHGAGGTAINNPATGTTRYSVFTSAGPNGSAALSADITAGAIVTTGALSTTHGNPAWNLGQTVILKPKAGDMFSFISATTSNSGGPTGASIVLSKPPGVIVSEIGSMTVTTPASGGGAISADTAATSPGTGVYTTLTGPVIDETNSAGMAIGNYTLTAPAGFEFDTGSNVGITIGTASGTGTNLTLASTSVTPTATTITFSVTGVSTNSLLNRLTFSNVRVRPVSGCPIANSGNILLASATTTTVTNNNAGTLVEVVGTASHIYTVLTGQTYGGCSGKVTGAPVNPLGYIDTLFTLGSLRVTDRFGNIVTSYNSATNITYTLSPANPITVTPVNPVAFTAGVSVPLSAIMTVPGNYTLDASAPGLTTVTSSTFNIAAGTVTVAVAAIGGDAIPSDTAAAAPGTGAYTSLTGLVIYETNIAGMAVGAYTLTAPPGFEFDITTIVTVTIGTASGTGSNLVLASTSLTPTASTITFNVTTMSTGTLLNRLSFSDLRIRPTLGCPLAAAGDIVFASTPVNTTVADPNAASLIQVAGAASHIRTVLTGQSYGSCGVIGSPTNPLGQDNSAFDLGSLRVTDQFGNISTTFNSSIAVSYTLTPPALGSTFTSPVTFSAGVSTTTLMTTITASGSFTIAASSTGLNGITSSAFNIESVAMLDHYAISYVTGDSGSTCTPSIVQITAHDNVHGLLNAPGGTTITLTASAGNWGGLVTGSGSWTNGGTAVETYTWSGGESFFQVELSRATAGITTINVVDNFGRTESITEDPPITFIATSLRISDVTGNAVSVGTQIAGKRSDEPPAPQAGQLFIQAIGCDAVISSITNLQMAFECNTPGTCAGGNQVAILETGGNMKPISGFANGTATPNTAINQTFSGDKAPLVLSYPDAGRISLHMSANVTVCRNGPCTQTTTTPYVGSSNEFVVRPFALSMESSDPGLHAVDADGDVFKKAGEGFDLNIRAVAWQAADDSNDDGMPDDAAVLTNNPTTPNFGAGGTATVELSHNLVLPAVPGDPGTLTGGAAIGGFSAGIATPTLSFDEVGIIDLVVSSDDYLGTPDADIIGTLKNVGRFTPHRFNVTANTPTFANTCTAGANPYTYQDQNFYYQDAPVLTVTALNAAGAITENYGGSGGERFWKLTPVLSRIFTDQTDGAGISHTLDTMDDIDVGLSGDTDFDGIGNLSLDDGSVGDVFLYERLSEEGEFDADIGISFAAANFIDADAVCYDPANDGNCSGLSVNNVSGSLLRFGRLVIGNNFGSELLPINVQFETQYFDGDGFVTNTDDVCTLIDDIDINSVPDIQLTSALESTMTGTVQVCPGGTSTFALGSNPLMMGNGDLSFSAPTAGVGCTGSVDISLNLPALGLAHLQYDWTGDTILDNSPTGRITFGVYKGSKEVIYIREPW